ncbi:MAG: 30S ribosomal protein S15 [Candidatus Paceibacterota bacterium]|nr:30S ribosomal protein S15 [Candidatus Paceibacterota bacterium]
MLKKKTKDTLIKKVRVHETDTGSPEVQIALLTKKIDVLADHLKVNKKDNHSRKGLLQMVADRRTHIKYLKKKNEARFVELAKKVGIKG